MRQIRTPVDFPRTQGIPNQIPDRDRERFGMEQADRVLEPSRNARYGKVCRRSQIPELRQSAKVPEISNQNNLGNEDSNLALSHSLSASTFPSHRPDSRTQGPKSNLFHGFLSKDRFFVGVWCELLE
jgi:hypothetical protein